jgi:hypothetical protein
MPPTERLASSTNRYAERASTIVMPEHAKQSNQSTSEPEHRPHNQEQSTPDAAAPPPARC